MTMTFQPEKVILGEGCIYSTNCAQTQLNNNIIVCGSSGSGKTMSISEPRLLATRNSSLVVTLSKRKLVSKYAPYYKRLGYNVMLLDFTTPSQSDVCYDPLAYAHSFSDTYFLAHSIVKANPAKEKNTSADPYWDDSATDLLLAEIYYTRAEKKGPRFSDVLRTHDNLRITDKNSMVATSLDDKFDILSALDPNNYAIPCWRTFKQLPIRTASCVFSTLNSTIASLFTPELRDMIDKKPSIDLSKIATQKTVLFIVVSPVNPALHRFVNMFYGQLFKNLFEFAENCPHGVLPVPVHVLCDDFATGSCVENFPEYISIFREKGISVTLLLQSESQLVSMYGEDDAITIINNCDTYVYLGGNDLRTGRSISERLNRPLDEVLYLPVGKEIIFRRGNQPVITERYNITKNPLYQRITQQYER